MSLHQTDNEKERTAQPATFLPFLLRPGRVVVDVAVNSASTWRSAVDEGGSRWGAGPRQSRNCIFVAVDRKHLISLAFLAHIERRGVDRGAGTHPNHPAI